MPHHGRWKPYVSVAQRRAQAAKEMAALRETGIDIQPVQVEGRKIAVTFWGNGWCKHLESFSDFENRLPRGRTYVRNGSVCHLAITKGKIEAKVAGSEIYDVHVKIKTLAKKRWTKIKTQCSGQIGSLLELLQGNLSNKIMAIVTDQKTGLFPKPAEIEFDCDCPDYAYMCKHVAAVLYGIGARLDNDPTLLFQLRDVNHNELIESHVTVPVGTGRGKSKRLADGNLGDVFGIDLDTTPVEKKKKKRTTKKTQTRNSTETKAKKTRTKKTKAQKTASSKRTLQKKTEGKTTFVDQAVSKPTKRVSKATKKPAKKKVTKKKTIEKASSSTTRKSSTKKRSTTAKRTGKKTKRNASRK